MFITPRSHTIGRFAVVAAVASLLTAFGALASTDPLAGSYSGNYGGKANDGTSVSGPTDVKFRAKSGGEAAQMTLKGEAPDGTKFTAKLVFNADGTCTTTALVPGVIEVPGTGTWSINGSGKKITYTLAGNVFITVVSTTGSVKIAGKKLKIAGKASASPPVPGLPSQGDYRYVGQ